MNVRGWRKIMVARRFRLRAQLLLPVFRRRGIARGVCVLGCLVLALICMAVAPAQALDAIVIGPDQDRIEITNRGVLYAGRGDRFQIETVPGPGDVAGRIGVSAATPGTNPDWIVFALHNPTDKPIERWLITNRYTIVGSGLIWPDLDAGRVVALTPSAGFQPERVANDRADIFRITLEPGKTVTYVAELTSARVARISLWNPLAYERTQRSRTLFNGVLLGLTGLLALFLTVIFAANHKAIFPTTALVSWCVLAYLCVDFGFWHKLFQLRADSNAIYRAACESAVAASLVIFLYTYLRLRHWHGSMRLFFGLWIVAQLSLVGIAIIDPRLASMFARGSMLMIGGVGFFLIGYLAIRGQDRALALVPTWMLFLVWLFGGVVILNGHLTGPMAVSGLVSGLVLLNVLLGFTVTQFAFRTIEPVYGAAPDQVQARAQAIDGAGAAVWDWNARRDEIITGAVVEEALGLLPGELSSKAADWLQHVHQSDRERLQLMMLAAKENNAGLIKIDLRMRRTDGSYRWFELEASSLPYAERRTLRCVGLMRDVTAMKRSQERLVHDAVHDSLTGMPNRELFLDRLGVAVTRAKIDADVRPTVMFIDLDKFRSVNSAFGFIVGDSLLLTVARRLASSLGAQDTLARVGGDQFAVLLVNSVEPRNLAVIAERMRRSLRSAVKIAGQDIILTGSIGITVFDGKDGGANDLLREAEIAMYRAKRTGSDRIEIFKPEMRSERDERIAIESDLRRALERRQLVIFYQPIVTLGTEELAGFEALVRWNHPKLGMLNPVDFIPVAEETDLIVQLGSQVLERATFAAARWHRELPRSESPLFVSVNVSSRQLFRQDLIQEIRTILGRSRIPRGCLKLEITESLVMENPEQAIEVLDWLRAAGAGISLDDFGTGYSSLAYLHRLPVDAIKIDRSFIQGISDEAGSGPSIVRSIVALADELQTSVVAEGVETPEDVAFLRSIGCEYAQGFYYGEPMSERDVISLLKVLRKSDRRVGKRSFFGSGKARAKDQRKQKDDEPKTVPSRPAPAIPVPVVDVSQPPVTNQVAPEPPATPITSPVAARAGTAQIAPNPKQGATPHRIEAAPEPSNQASATLPPQEPETPAVSKIDTPTPASPVDGSANGGKPAVVSEPVSADMARALLGQPPNPSGRSPTPTATETQKAESTTNGHVSEPAVSSTESEVAKEAVPIPSLPPGVADLSKPSDDAAKAPDKEAVGEKPQSQGSGK